MPYFIATGKDAHSESSVKVEADTAIEAVKKAREQLPVITRLEGIEPDGTLVAITDITFDLPQTEIRSFADIRKEQTKVVRRRHATWRAFVILSFAFAGTAFYEWLSYYTNRHQEELRNHSAVTDSRPAQK